MPHNQCPPSRRGHAWRELSRIDGPLMKLPNALEIRICKRCQVLGRVSSQGVIHVVEVP